MQIKVLNLTRHPLSKAQLEAACTTTLDKIEPMYRRDVARNLSVCEVRVEIKPTPDATLDGARVAWDTDAIIPWIDVRMPGARALHEAVNARLRFDLTRGGNDWSCGVTAGAKWWMIHGWDDLDKIVGGGVMMDQDKINDETQARIDATIDRLIVNIAAACQVLDEQGYVSLRNQLQRDRANLTYWRANGWLRFEEGE